MDEQAHLVPYKRTPKNIFHHYNDDGSEIRWRAHSDDCPICGKLVIWRQDLDSWIEDPNTGKMEPAWDQCAAWHCECTHCLAWCSDPYEDGLVRVWDGRDFE